MGPMPPRKGAAGLAKQDMTLKLGLGLGLQFALARA
jgi:hypothetical protein